jgi:hypothetical protein
LNTNVTIGQAAFGVGVFVFGCLLCGPDSHDRQTRSGMDWADLPAKFPDVLAPTLHHSGAGGDYEVAAGECFSVVPWAFGAQGIQAFEGLRASGNHIGWQFFLSQKTEPHQGTFVFADGRVEFLTCDRVTDDVQPEFVEAGDLGSEQPGFFGFRRFEAPLMVLQPHGRE